MFTSTSRISVRAVLAAVIVTAFCAGTVPAQTTAPQPGGRGKAAPKRPAQKPAPPVVPVAPKAAEPAPPPKPVATDVRLKTIYVNGDMRTESVMYQKGERQRYEFGD